eukprot:5011028-Prymnesium_polylepis.1
MGAAAQAVPMGAAAPPVPMGAAVLPVPMGAGASPVQMGAGASPVQMGVGALELLVLKEHEVEALRDAAEARRLGPNRTPPPRLTACSAPPASSVPHPVRACIASARALTHAGPAGSRPPPRESARAAT